MTMASRYLVEPGERACGEGALLVRDPTAFHVVTARASRFAIGPTPPGQFAEVTATSIDACGGEFGARFSIRADDERCFVVVRVRVQLVAMAEPVPPEDGGRFESILSEDSVKCPGGGRTVATSEAVAERAEAWRREIRRRWSRQHRIRALGDACPCEAYDVDIDVEWVTENPHQTVSVHSGCGDVNSQNLYVDMSDYTAAHEFGHWLGLLDEYPGPCTESTGLHSIMWGSDIARAVGVVGRVQPFHYHFFAEWLARTRCCDFEIGSLEDIGGLLGDPAEFESMF